MIKRTLLIAAALVGFSAPAFAAEGTPVPPQLKWSFHGPFGNFDRAQLQRGFKVYREVCASCHGLSYVAFRNLAGAGRTGILRGAGSCARGRVHDPGRAERCRRHVRASWPRRPTVSRSPFPNENAAAAANGGKAPPDLSLMAKARTYERGFPWFVIDMFTQFAENGAGLRHGRSWTATRSLRRASRFRTAGTTTSTSPATSSRCRSPSATARWSIPSSRRPAAGSRDGRAICSRRNGVPHVDGGAASRGAQAPRLPGRSCS